MPMKPCRCRVYVRRTIHKTKNNKRLSRLLIHIVFITIYTTSVDPFIPIPCLSVSHHREKHKNIVFPDQLYKKLQVNCLQEKSQSHTDPLLPLRIDPRKHRPSTTCPHIKSSPRNALYTLSLDPTRFKRVRA